MISSPPESHNEAARIAALRAYEILDTQAEAVFDRLVQIAAASFNVPTALLSLVDDRRQWFKARTGIALSETAREESFCQHVVTGGPLVVPDASKDARFRDLPLVTGDLSVRFYAGVPLVSPDGHAIGSLCVVDRRARAATAVEVRLLEHLASLTMELLEQRALLRRQRESELERMRIRQERDWLLAAAESSLRQVAASERLHRLMFESHPQPLWAYDIETLRFVAVNQAAVDSYGYTREEFLGMTIKEIRPPEDVPSLMAHLATTPSPLRRAPADWRHRRKDGTVFATEVVSHPLEIEGRPGMLVMATDISEKRNLQDQFLRAQRMENLGMLAAGISHDLNNIFTPLMMVAPLLGSRLTGENDRRILATVEQSVRRGAGLVKQILTFSRGTDGASGPVQLKHIGRDIIGMITETFPRSINFQATISPDLLPVRGNPTQVHQILLNLTVNARDAMPNGGELRLAIENCEFTPDTVIAVLGARVGRFIRIEVSDTGCGIAPEIAERIWEPFFSTKGLEKGTGLGLSTVRGIVARHNGFIDLKSEVGRGTTFRVYLPAELEYAPTPDSTPSPEVPRGRDELVLFVDDEPDIATMAAAALSAHGYRVITCPNAAQALQAFRDNPDVRLVITDFHMPGMDGEKLAAELRRHRPKLPIMICSGTSGHTWAGVPNEHTLMKPFAANALLQAVREVLASAAAA